VRSPTFTIVNRYPVDRGTIKHILHVDLYRLRDVSEIPALALEEELRRVETVAFVEWPERAQGLLGTPTGTCSFLADPEGVHRIILPPRRRLRFQRRS
jgi:tRNA A37 threonylcarbamoyladenosine biosynthesis protein TsaE